METCSGLTGSCGLITSQSLSIGKLVFFEGLQIGLSYLVISSFVLEDLYSICSLVFFSEQSDELHE